MTRNKTKKKQLKERATLPTVVDGDGTFTAVPCPFCTPLRSDDDTTPQVTARFTAIPVQNGLTACAVECSRCGCMGPVAQRGTLLSAKINALAQWNAWPGNWKRPRSSEVPT